MLPEGLVKLKVALATILGMEHGKRDLTEIDIKKTKTKTKKLTSGD